MLIIIGLLVIGGLIGYLFRRVFSKELPENGNVLTIVVLLMLLCFGASIGSNPKVMDEFYTLGLKGLCFGLTALLGSAVACMALQTIFTDNATTNVSGNARRKISVRTVIGSMSTLVSFISGVIIGKFAGMTESVNWGEISEWLLYLLILTVSLGIGNRQKLSSVFTKNNSISLLLPVFSIAGTIIAGVGIGLFPVGFDMGECVTAVSGMGYYSLSSVLINNLKATETGVEAAMQLGAIALVGNIIRELATLVLAPVIYAKMGRYALIGASGVTSMDVCLPTITAVCGTEAVAPALVNGIILEILTPFLVTSACML